MFKIGDNLDKAKELFIFGASGWCFGADLSITAKFMLNVVGLDQQKKFNHAS